MARNRSILFALLSLALVGGACDNDHCESLRDELTEFKDAWSSCETDYDCQAGFICISPGACHRLCNTDFNCSGGTGCTGVLAGTTREFCL